MMGNRNIVCHPILKTANDNNSKYKDLEDLLSVAAIMGMQEGVKMGRNLKKPSYDEISNLSDEIAKEVIKDMIK